ncbi:hypothetical protein [Paenarthrobacter sp. NPDC058040]|uniref:hypothetical protein n=1 Tax=unclassified Paenarthrobacter TaxID=2634190 RepID=UPI0036DDA3B0
MVLSVRLGTGHPGWSLALPVLRSGRCRPRWLTAPLRLASPPALATGRRLLAMLWL